MLVVITCETSQITYPSAESDPELGIIRLSFPVLAFEVVDPECNARCLFGYTGHVGIPCVPVDV